VPRRGRAKGKADRPCAAPSGTLPAEVIRKMGSVEPTYYRCKEIAGMGVTEIRRLKQLEDVNARLKKLMADLV